MDATPQATATEENGAEQNPPGSADAMDDVSVSSSLH